VSVDRKVEGAQCAVGEVTGSLQVAILCGLDVPDTRCANTPSRYSAPSSQELINATSPALAQCKFRMACSTDRKCSA